MSMFQRRHYVRFAEAIRFADARREIKLEILDFCIEIFKADNGLFREEQFRKACRFEEWIEK